MTIGYWTSVARSTALYSLNYRNEKIGKADKIVEIDEAAWRRRKYKKGEEELGKKFVIIVPNRKKETPIPIIKNRIKEGSTIISDEWKAHSCLGEIGYTHQTVCHKRHYVDPVTKANTNTIEGMCVHLRSFFPLYGVRERFIPGVLATFIVKRSCFLCYGGFIEKVINFQSEDEFELEIDDDEVDENEEIPDINEILGIKDKEDTEEELLKSESEDSDPFGAGPGEDSSKFEP
ncbi:putative ISXO2-like transposase domain [Monocercomonoides exilis]|uniref:putative ISXO2-like transposase domain n=1 Tax=Monocercomonoides exilis TaxID=2049356 RepID=UPI00355A95FA|nr:putative ISXO2-like transposase domain [Monocercomonoides exilis]|eukprot:MONOS_10215.1-p1 / transcript=MONOS_10215.1 / gene=MONOS_10215 / organism=Monocercomonoides_exilis_PA203 / gene_product=unspecified product / transcript_product=unspecified product / location=Mono_scaffold00455:7120-7943(+) / protein_length=232 / sequence_SO=supercontig / SO=protein_coding / is_pseudo=false